MTAVARVKSQVARPLKILVPLIQEELAAGDEAGLDHYANAGDMLIESKEQVAAGRWSRWLNENFELSQQTARRYMQVARERALGYPKTRGAAHSIEDALGVQTRRERHVRRNVLHEAIDKVNVTRLVDERQARDTELKLHREIALKLIDLGYRAMATRLHPDRGGSRDAMSRLNTVRDELKSIAETRRFV